MDEEGLPGSPSSLFSKYDEEEMSPMNQDWSHMEEGMYLVDEEGLLITQEDGPVTLDSNVRRPLPTYPPAS